MRTTTPEKKKRTIKHFTCQTVARLPGQVNNKQKKVNI